MRSITNTHLKLSNSKDFDKFGERYPEFKKTMMLYEKNVLFRNKSNSIDYKYPGESLLKNGQILSVYTLARENLLKNIVLNILNTIRIEKKKPRLMDIL